MTVLLEIFQGRSPDDSSCGVYTFWLIIILLYHSSFPSPLSWREES
jgi:hypothetical protein